MKEKSQGMPSVAEIRGIHIGNRRTGEFPKGRPMQCENPKVVSGTPRASQTPSPLLCDFLRLQRESLESKGEIAVCLSRRRQHLVLLRHPRRLPMEGAVGRAVARNARGVYTRFDRYSSGGRRNIYFPKFLSPPYTHMRRPSPSSGHRSEPLEAFASLTARAPPLRWVRASPDASWWGVGGILCILGGMRAPRGQHARQGASCSPYKGLCILSYQGVPR